MKWKIYFKYREKILKDFKMTNRCMPWDDNLKRFKMRCGVLQSCYKICKKGNFSTRIL